MNVIKSFRLAGFGGLLLLSANVVAQQRSWVDLERYSGERGSSAITQGDFRQLVYELQAEQRADEGVTRRRRPAARAYQRLQMPRNNERAQQSLSVVHWTRALPEGTNVPVFAFAPLRPTTYRGGQLQFMIAPDDLFESAEQPIVQMQLDAGDGTGLQPIEPGVPVTVSYDSTGEKDLQLEAVLADGSTRTASASLAVEALATPDPTETISLQAAAPYTAHSGLLYVLKSGAHAGLKCPVFVVEGFDMNNDMDWDVLYNILNKEQLAETLLNYGRDLVVLDFTDATADIIGNAHLAIAALNYINANRADASDKFTMIGASMGGLVSRYALAASELDPTTYGTNDVNTWISFDSPQTGANIPLGLQQFFGFFGEFADDYSDLAMIEEFQTKLDSVAAKQMLLVHYSSGAALAANPGSAAFWNAMNALGYPAACKKITISNGSGFGDLQPFVPGEQIIHWDHDSFLLEIGCRIYALKKSPSTPATLFYGRFDPWDLFDLVDERQTISKYSTYALDNISGGTRGSFQELFDNLPSSYVSSSDWCNYPDHCFIPMTSSLGLPVTEIEEIVDGNSAVLALSPFDEVHYAITNEQHISINERNKRWFVRAVLEDVDTDADGFDDYAEYLAGTDYDAAADRLTVQLGLDVVVPVDVSLLSWAAYPNTQYNIYFTDSLTNEWAQIDTITPVTDPLVIADYPLTAGSTNGFFKVVADLIDPVTD